MVKNAIVSGFNTKSESDAIKQLEKESYFNIKEWISNHSKYSTIHINDFNYQNLKYLKTHKYNKEYKKIYDLHFHRFIESISRSRDVDFSYYEFNNMFNIHFYYFYELIIKHNIKLLICSNFLHLTDYLLYAIAKDLFNIQIIIFNQSQFPNKMWYMDSIEDYGSFEKLKQLNLNNKVDEELKNKLEINLFYMKKSFFQKLKEYCLYKFIFKDLEKIFNKRKNEKFYHFYLRYIKCLKYKKNLAKYSAKEVDYNAKYVYFPLHLQPELTTSIFGDIHTDQLLAIEKLSSILPDDFKIYAKENPKQGYYQRDDLFFKRLMNIDKVVLVDKSVDTHKLTKNSQFLSTISGTAGWEAITSAKKVLLFGRAWYQSLPGVFLYNEKFSYEELAKYNFTKEMLQKQYIQLLSNTFDGVVDEAYIANMKNFSHSQNQKNIYYAISTILNHKGND